MKTIKLIQTLFLTILLLTPFGFSKAQMSMNCYIEILQKPEYNCNNASSKSLIPFNENVRLKEEDYINDIPFDTEEIARKYEVIFPYMEEEQSTNDIPFDTEKIAREYEIIFPYFQEESYINDIPFDIHNIVPPPTR